MDFASASDHQKRDGAIYIVKGNWALQKGMMIPGSAGYIEDVDIPGRQLGCMCHLIWLSRLTDLPDDMLTDLGKEAVMASRERARQIMSEWEKESSLTTFFLWLDSNRATYKDLGCTFLSPHPSQVM
ncbi:MAG: hypothetical protein WC934_07860 [Acidithiobacillus sp.]|jgi:hypothetical protein|uniref:hypothetical protein n=2 Tax=Acidithiobacillus sp. TaxID=1872118 RepID=UPI00355D0279